MDNDSDVYCKKCGIRLKSEPLDNTIDFDRQTGKPILDDRLFLYQCPNYKDYFLFGNGHDSFLSEYRYRHSSWN